MPAHRLPNKLEQKHDPGETCITDFWWYKNDQGYAMRNGPKINGKSEHIRAHREVLAAMLGRPLVAGEEVDHLNGDRCDNRRDNLRLVTRKQNCQNQHHADGFRGTYYNKARKKWYAQVGHNGTTIYLGLFVNRAEAAAEAAAKRKALGFLTSNH